ncbi:WSSV071 [White spot syndrome virus]|nr:WSSV071 [White spot syndrome virus]
MGKILRDLHESDDDDDDYFDDEFDGERSMSETIATRRAGRIQYGPGFLSHSNILNRPAKARA